MSDRRYEELARALDEDGDPGLDLFAGLYPSVAAVVGERDRLRAAVEALRPYRVAIRANDEFFQGAGGLADAILGAVAALDPKEGA